MQDTAGQSEREQECDAVYAPTLSVPMHGFKRLHQAMQNTQHSDITMMPFITFTHLGKKEEKKNQPPGNPYMECALL